MLLACIALAITLGIVGAVAWQREQHWRGVLARVAANIGLPATPATPATPASETAVVEKLRLMQRDRSELSRELYLRRLFESLLSEIRQGVIIVDLDLKVCFANKTIGQLFQRPAIHRQKPLLDELQDHQIVGVVRAALEAGSRVVRQIRYVGTASASTTRPTARHYLVEAAPLPPTAEPGAWLMVHDVTEQVLTEQIRKDFVANASHELRTPLTLIQGYIETLQSGLISDLASATHCLAVMDKHGKRIIRIIEDMLTISRLEASDAALNIEPFNLRACVQDAIDHLVPMLEGRNVVFDLDFPSDGGLLHGDRFYWDQVLTNLLENAIKENPNRDLTIRVSGQWQAAHCTLTVSDNGVGIPAHDIPFVFKRFYRGHKHHAQTIKGTGLGLSIVRRTVEAHQGTIHLHSIPGQETTFTIKVPAELPLTPAASPPADTAPAYSELG
jgi:two-component system phosphate regulon sensor histidine kinase PhoR